MVLGEKPSLRATFWEKDQMLKKWLVIQKSSFLYTLHSNWQSPAVALGSGSENQAPFSFSFGKRIRNLAFSNW